MSIEKEAIEHIKKLAKSRELYKLFADESKYLAYPTPTTFFMAGSTGAGKTEASIRFIKNINQEHNFPIVRIDADEIREILPNYNGQNAHLFQEAAILGVNKLYDYVNKKRFNVLMDGTFRNEEYAINNVKIALQKGREVYIIYIFQDPLIAWEFTLKREKLQKRKITKEIFIDSFIKAKENVDKIKSIFKDKVRIILIKKNYYGNDEKFWLNKDNIDSYIEFNYTRESLNDIIKNVSI